MNADDIEIDIERFIYEIQIRREFGIRRIGICSSKEDIFIRANKKNIRICSQIGIKGDKQSFFTPICWYWMNPIQTNSLLFFFAFCICQRWSPRGRPWPRGYILMFLALASMVKSLTLASKPQILENCPVLGSRTALFFGLLKV